MAARFPASNSHPLLLFNPKIVAFFVCPGKNSALAEKAKFPLPLSGIPDSWNPKIGRYISQGSTRETKEIDIDIDVRRHYNCGGRSEIVVQSKDGGRTRAEAEAVSAGGMSSAEAAVLFFLVLFSLTESGPPRSSWLICFTTSQLMVCLTKSPKDLPSNT